jgi:tetratricopeptide (TPR) repeat protein
MNNPHDPNATADHIAPAPADALRTTDHVRASASTDGSHPPADAPADDLPVVPGYRVLREIARGGMGRVLGAFDLTLDRDVALKVLLPGANSDRFVRESKITARLPHPGIPPVYALGTLADGAPFLAMKLIAGRTLADEMKSADQPRLLQAFTQVCQAVGFAHSRGIIHRDLKPANVMVGAFGEVQVMDWGLAKDRTSQEANDAPPPSQPSADPGATTAHSAAGEATDEQTRAGMVLGTPAYMAPEQARGQATDARSDVFALGGILCAILTGRPPFSGKSALELIRRAGAADLADANARLDRCGADAELIALCRRCLSPNPADRPAEGQAVAEQVAAYLDGVQERLRRAELAQAEARAKAAEEVKRRRLTLLLAATVLLALLLGGGGWLYVKSERDAQQRALARRQVELTQGVNEALTSATALREKAKSAKTGGVALFAQAREQVQRAVTLVENGLADEGLAEQVRQLRDEVHEEAMDRHLAVMLDEAWMASAQMDARHNKLLFGRESEVPFFRKALQAYGMPAGEVEPAVAALRIARRPAALREAIVAALADWLAAATNPAYGIHEPHQQWLETVLAAPELQDAWARQLQLARAERDPVRIEKLLQTADITQVPVQGLVWALDGLPSATKLRWLRQLQTQFPDNFWANELLGTVLANVPGHKQDDVLRYLTVAVALRPDSAGARGNLGLIAAQTGHAEEALVNYRKAVELEPTNAVAHHNLAYVLGEQHRWDEALFHQRKAVELAPLLGIEGPNQSQFLAVVHNNLGVSLITMGRFDEAIDCLKKTIAYDPKDAVAHTHVGVAFKEKREADAAIAWHRKAIQLDPNLAQAYDNLGGVLCDLKQDYDGAIANFRKAIALSPNGALRHFNLGNALKGKGDLDAAIACWKKVITLPEPMPGVHAKARVALARAEAVVAVEDKLPALLKGNYRPGTNDERLRLAELCRLKKLYRTTAGLYADAFAADPKLADDLKAWHRYNAACWAALAAAGQGEDAAKLDDMERARLRKQALDWLKADLALHTKKLESGRPADRAEVQRVLKEWQGDTDFAGIRGQAALEKLPPDEQKAFTQLWADVAALLQKADPSSKENSK